MAKKILVLASGGLDSSVVLALYKNLGYDVHTLYINYGNINKHQEIFKLENIRSKFNIPIRNSHFLDITIPWSKGGCLKSDNPNPYIEMRNLIFLSNAVSLAESLEIDEIAVGFISVPIHYPDSSQEFLDNFNQLSLSSSGIVVRAPLLNLTKQGVYELGVKLGIDLKSTISCNQPVDGEPCGKCVDCEAIQDIIQKLNIPDGENPFK